MIETYIAGLAVLAFYWVADCSTRGPLERLLSGVYGPFEKHCLVIASLFLWPITLVAIAAGSGVLIFIGSIIDRDNKTIAWMTFALLLVGIILSMAGQTGRKISWGVE